MSERRAAQMRLGGARDFRRPPHRHRTRSRGRPTATAVLHWPLHLPSDATTKAEPILLARHGSTECFLLPELANRHHLVTGATGTGKTVTLQPLAENFSRQGVPVFLADVKGA